MADSPNLPSSLNERLKRLDKALDSLDRALDRAIASPAAAKGVGPGLAQSAALSELQGRVSRLVAHLEKAANGAAPKQGGSHAAD